ncbi:GlsB/YeaQ/YmgE family stress response membrane protein [Halomonas sp. AOP13-D3-9]
MGSLIGALIIGGLAGWIAGNIMRGGGFGILGNIGVGIVGAFIGRMLFGLLGLASGNIIGSLVTATVGAVVLLWVISKVKQS